MKGLAVNPIPSMPWRLLLPFVLLLSGCVTGGASKPSFVLAQFDLAPPASANGEIVPASQSEDDLEAMRAVTYESGVRYRLDVAVGTPATIRLQPGETVGAHSAADPKAWMIDQVADGDSAILLVNATRPNLETTLIVSTDRRIYLIEAISHDDGGDSTALAWTYPTEGARQNDVAVLPAAGHDAAAASAVPDQPRTVYEIAGDQPGWRPVHAYGAGDRSVIEFPAAWEATLPALYVEDNNGEPARYHAALNRYIIEQDFDRAELRLSGSIVRIARSGPITSTAWFRGKATSSNAIRPCRTCRDSDDHGERDRSGHHDADHHGMGS
jgi:type IV secretory pathway VirB9-like protein